MSWRERERGGGKICHNILMSVHCMAIDDEVGVGGHNGDVFEYCVSKKSYSFLFGQNFFLGHTVSILAIRVAAPG